jgi:glycine/D-amino acid oxidase-like deaminating enzyme
MTKVNGRSPDIVIVGAGVIGASIAFHLAKRRAGHVVVIEREHIGKGGSGRSSALIRMHYTFPAEVQLAVKSLEIFENWKEIVGEPGEFRKTGFVRLVPNNEIDLLKANVAMLKSYGVKTDVIDCSDLKKLEPDWNLDDEPGIAYEPDSGYGDGAIVAQDFMSAARAMGVEYRPKTRVNGILVNGEQVTGISTTAGDVHCSRVVLANGPWSPQLVRELGIVLPIAPEFHEVAILRNPAGMKRGGAACIDSAHMFYFRSDSSDKTLIGDFYGKREHIDADNFPQRPSDEWIEEILEKACRRIPGLQNAEVMRGVTGLYDMTPDRRPLLGEVKGIRGLYVAAGFSGTGFKISPAVGIAMSELLLDGASKNIDISAFRPSRFEEGQPIKGQFEYQNDYSRQPTLKRVRSGSLWYPVFLLRASN